MVYPILITPVCNTRSYSDRPPVLCDGTVRCELTLKATKDTSAAVIAAATITLKVVPALLLDFVIFIDID
jgi:hypothetical protein